jgi:hypothetical protein
MRRKAVDLSSLCLRQARDLFGDLLAIGLLAKVPGFRNRSFPLPVVFWTFVCQVLANGSCRHGVTSVQALLGGHGNPDRQHDARRAKNERFQHRESVSESLESGAVHRRLEK